MSGEEEAPPLTAEQEKQVASAVVRSQVERVASIRVSVEDLMSLGAEMAQLREQVTHLQAMGTSQLSASRDACFEVAALKCEALAAEVPQNAQAQTYCAECARAIRLLVSKG